MKNKEVIDRKLHLWEPVFNEKKQIIGDLLRVSERQGHLPSDYSSKGVCGGKDSMCEYYQKEYWPKYDQDINSVE